MNIHEYQGRQLFRDYGLPVPPEEVCESPEEVQRAATEMEGPVVVKAQVHVGGRGKAGGVKLAKDSQEAYDVAEQILGMDLKGITVRKVLVAPAVDIAQEFYVGITVDRATQQPTFMVSRAGGVDIEEVAATTPEKIVKVGVDPLLGLTDYQCRELGAALFDDIGKIREAAPIFKGLYQCFMENDCSLAEINPLITTNEGGILAIDAKVNLDDNALYRHPELEELRDMFEEDAQEMEANEAGLAFVGLDGNIGLLVNGAGLAMATVDMVALKGGAPANFLDVGGSSNPQKVVTALKILTSNRKVRSILFNIFGGITRCDDIAKGLLAALDELKIDLPIIIRLTGTNEDEAKRLLQEANLSNLTTADTMAEGVDKAIAAATR